MINHDELKAKIRKSGDFQEESKRYLEKLLDEAEILRHGEWIESAYIDTRSCSLCDCTCISYQKYNFCPNCGARMDGGVEK